MDFQIKTDALSLIKADCLLVGIPVNGEWGTVSKSLDDSSNGFLSRQRQQGNLPQKAGECRLFVDCEGIAAKRLLVVALDDEPYSLKQAIAAALKVMDSLKLKSIISDFGEECIADEKKRIRKIAYEFAHQDYHFDKYKSDKKDRAEKKLIFHPRTIDRDAVEEELRSVRALISGEELTRNLGNMPPNECSPKYLGKTAEKLAKKYENLQVSLLNKKEMKELGMGALLAVAQGSRRSPRLIVFKYTPEGLEDQQPVVLVGKGVCFDSGGISLKPSAAMDEMKYDMCGAATVFGMIKAACELNLQQSIVGIVPAVENMPDGGATRPGDIVKTMSGKTVEILNTDAEGRLILCDALSYAARYQPDVVIDMATLTGACVVALGHEYSAVLGNHPPLLDALIQSSEKADDGVWPLPLNKAYKRMLKSPFADLPNISAGRAAGTITAAAFLAAFCEDYRWAHIDIAGTAWVSEGKKCATGRPLPTLFTYLCDRAENEQ